MSDLPSPAEIVSFWRGAGPARWFSKDAAFDAEIRSRFLPTYEAAARRELERWADEAEGALALILVLDQFPRNIFRDNPKAFATDAHAREIAYGVVGKGFADEIGPPLKRFFFLPMMHSEGLADQQFCVEMLTRNGDAEGAAFGRLHLDIIARFGRFPHRNAVLGRQTTPEEQAFLDAGGFAG